MRQCVRNYLLLAAIVSGLAFPTVGQASHSDRIVPKTANYYLGLLKDTPEFLRDLARYDLLILTPAQIAAHPEVIAKVKEHHPGVTILAYVPSQSYDTRYWPEDVIFRDLHPENEWWLRDPEGNIFSSWPGVLTMNMHEEWSRYLVEFTNERIATLPHVDGIFFDVVGEAISWANEGNIDVNNDRVRDTSGQADRLWSERVRYLLEYASDHLDTTYIIINGTSYPHFQPYVNGRMFETFPTPWEGDGSWTTVMNNLRSGKHSNREPHLIIINGNTLNTGERNNFQAVRFGIASSLLEDNIFYSFDFGDQDHGQLWWYDEYGINLGTPVTTPVVYDGNGGKKASATYAPGIWRRDFKNGISIVNSTDRLAAVDLYGEFEKIHGSQDTLVNDGMIVSETTLEDHDGLLLLKTFATIPNILFTNGNFARLFRPTGERVRNGFFAFDDGYAGGDGVAQIDLNADGETDRLLLSRRAVIGTRHDGQPFMKEYPYTANYKGEMNVAIGDVNGDGKVDIVVAPGAGAKQPIKIYTHDGQLLTDDWWPLGKNYTGGMSVAVGDVDAAPGAEIVIGAGSGIQPYVYVYTPKLKQLRRWLAFGAQFRGGVSVATGNLDGDGKSEIIVGSGKGLAPSVKVFDSRGKSLYKEFKPFTPLAASPGIRVSAADVDFDGREDIVVLSEGTGF